MSQQNQTEYLDFELPIAELEAKIESLRSVIVVAARRVRSWAPPATARSTPPT